MVDVNVELPADRWRAIDPDVDCLVPEALLFVNGVRRIEARVWIDENSGSNGQATQASAALCASYAAGVVCCSGHQARLVQADIRRGLFTVAPHASDIATWAGNYGARPVAGKAAGTPLMVRLSQALQRHLAEVEVVTAVEARAAVMSTACRRMATCSWLTAVARTSASAARPRLHQVPSQYLPATGTEYARGRAYARAAHSRVPDGYQLGSAQLVSTAAWPVWIAVGGSSAHRMLGRPACFRGDPPRGREPEMPRKVRLSRLQGCPRATEPLPHRRA